MVLEEEYTIIAIIRIIISETHLYFVLSHYCSFF